MSRRGAVRQGVDFSRPGTVGHAQAGHGVAWSGPVRQGVFAVRSGSVGCGMVWPGSARYGMVRQGVFMIYGRSYQKAKLERMEFAGKRCEICNHDGSEYRLECHHRGDKAYKKDERDELEMGDVLIVCERHHDAITESDRKARYAKRSSFELESHVDKLIPLKVKHESQSKIDWYDPPGNAQQPNGKPVGQVQKTDWGDYEQEKKDGR